MVYHLRSMSSNKIFKSIFTEVDNVILRSENLKKIKGYTKAQPFIFALIGALIITFGAGYVSLHNATITPHLRSSIAS